MRPVADANWTQVLSNCPSAAGDASARTSAMPKERGTRGMKYLVPREARGTRGTGRSARPGRSVDAPEAEEHTSELQSQFHLVCRLLLEKKKKKKKKNKNTRTKQNTHNTSENKNASSQNT